MMSALGPCEATDLAASLRRYCERHGNEGNLRDLRHYALHGRVYPAHAPLEALPDVAADALLEALARAPLRLGDAYLGSVRLALAIPGARYCEGLYADLAFPFPRQHAWVSVGGLTLDPACLAEPAAPLGPSPTYFGVEFAPDLAASVMLGEGRARPVALGPPRPLQQRLVEDSFVGLS